MYAGVESTGTSGAIYSIGGTYVPGTTTLGNMYGIGYGYSGNAGITATSAPASLWGMYVASAGVSRIFFDSDNGRGFFNGAVYSAGTVLTGNTGTVTSVGGTAPVVSSGGTAPVISMAAASSGVNGYMTGTYATKLDGIAAGATNVTNTNQLTNGAGYITSSGSISGNAATASATLMSAGRTDGTAYPVVWGTTGSTSQLFSCTAVNIQSSTGTLNATNLNATTGAFSGQVTQSGNSATIYGPNSSWASYLQVGGNGRTVSGTNYASIATTNGNMHIDSGSTMAMYLNFYSGTAGINFGNGATGIIGTVSAAGALSMNGNITAYSDERLKKDWTPLVSDFVEKLAAVKAGTYTRIDSGERQAGSSAQDWQELLPEVVTEGADEAKTLALAYGNAALVSAVQLAKRVVDQDMRIAKLEALVAQLTKNIAL
jgi:hypothetical protein